VSAGRRPGGTAGALGSEGGGDEAIASEAAANRSIERGRVRGGDRGDAGQRGVSDRDPRLSEAHACRFYGELSWFSGKQILKKIPIPSEAEQ